MRNKATRNNGVKTRAALYVYMEIMNGSIDHNQYFLSLNPFIKSQAPKVTQKTENEDSNDALVNWICQGEIARRNEEIRPIHLLSDISFARKYSSNTVNAP